MIKSFLKFPGSKRQMLSVILPWLQHYGRVVEPFAGSAVVAINAHRSALVSDTNLDIINVMCGLKYFSQFVITEARELFKPRYNTEKAYYKLRDEFNTNRVNLGARRDALFLYLNRHGFNGLCRYNKSGGFNVPFGRYANPGLPLEALENFAERAKNMTFQCEDFRVAFTRVQEGDVVFCDPPYLPLSVTSSFTSYGKDGFTTEDHEALAACAKAAANRLNNVRTIVTSSDTPLARKIYGGAKKIVPVEIRRSISATLGGRGMVKEIMAIY